MKIIAGKLRGKKIKAPKGLSTRPVPAMVREAFFNILGDVEGFRVLDLYAGTGAVGIEALSRGAESSVFVDFGSQQCRIIRENLSSIKVNSTVIKADVERTLKKFQTKEIVFDLVFVDPPYEKGLSLKTVSSVCEKGLLSDSGILAVTVRFSEELPRETGECKQFFDRRYGNTRLVMYKKCRRHFL